MSAMKERNHETIAEGGIWSDIILPGLFAIIILLCLIQLSLALLQPGALHQVSPEQMPTISAFMS
jgi:hypothetical protein